MTISLNCIKCGSSFKTFESQRNRRKFCSRSCKENFKKVELSCICGVVFSVSPSESLRRNRKCCSRKCKDMLRFLHSHKVDSEGNILYKKCPLGKNWLDKLYFGNNTSTKTGISSLCRKCGNDRKKINKYGLPDNYFENALTTCEVCESSENLHIDHCHTIGSFRGVLCSNCNTSLGLLKEDVTIVENLLTYIKSRCTYSSLLMTSGGK
jgi:hypothetical protein